MWLLAASALAADRTATVLVGLGGSLLAGGNADAYGAGVVQRVAVELPLGHASAFAVELDHTRHVLRDAGGYFPGDDVPTDAIEGFRDYTALDAGFRVGGVLPLGDDELAAVPYGRLGLAAVYTTTLVGAPSFDGRVALRSNRLWPALSMGAGCELRVRRWFAVVPHLKVQVLADEDYAEVDGYGVWGLEWRIQPAVDASFSF